MSESDDLPDFMSDSFLAQLSDVRPGLHLKTSSSARSQQQTKHSTTVNKDKCSYRAEKLKLKQEKEVEAFNTALETPLFSQTDKGVGLSTAQMMMLRMGHEFGRGLGKREQGRLEPVPIIIKSDRSGLGHLAPSLRSRKRSSAAASTSTPAENSDAQLRSKTADFRLRMSAKFARADADAYLAQAQRACKRLDMKMASETEDSAAARDSLKQPTATWFWPPEEMTDPNDNDVDEDETEADKCSPDEKLRLIVDHLRRTHFFCLWCGWQFGCYAELLADCPGPERTDH